MNTFNGSDGKRAKQAEATRKAVLEAARAEFEAVGFDAANLRAIAKRAGVSPGTVIHHHGDKRELLHAALFETLDAALRKALATPKPGPLEARLAHVTKAVLRSYAARPKLSRTLLKESLFAEGPWAARFVQQATHVHGALAAFVVEAKAAGELREDVDPALFAIAYLSFFYFALISWTQGAHGRPAALVAHLVDAHLAGCRPPPRPSRSP